MEVKYGMQLECVCVCVCVCAPLASVWEVVLPDAEALASSSVGDHMLLAGVHVNTANTTTLISPHFTQSSMNVYTCR